MPNLSIWKRVEARAVGLGTKVAVGVACYCGDRGRAKRRPRWHLAVRTHRCSGAEGEVQEQRACSCAGRHPSCAAAGPGGFCFWMSMSCFVNGGVEWGLSSKAFGQFLNRNLQFVSN